jgi:trypsin
MTYWHRETRFLLLVGVMSPPTEDHIQIVSDVLMSVEVKVMSNDDCEASRGMAYGYEQSLEGQITSNMVCAKDDGEDSCQGDSGGPAVVHNIDPSKDVQVGVVSWGIGCAHSSFPGVYARVSAAYDWIRQEVCARSYDPSPSFQCNSNVSFLDNSGNGSEAEKFVSAAEKFASSPGSLHHKSAHNGVRGSPWTTVMEEDFTSGSIFFSDAGMNRHVYTSVKGKSGVLRLSNDESISSRDINGSYARFEVLLTFQFLDVEQNHGLCLDYSVDHGASWTEFSCHRSDSTFENEVWYEDVSSDFEPSAETESLSIRLRSSETQGDILVDKVVLKVSK